MPRRSSDRDNEPRGALDASRETAAPWSITLPVAAGVFLGSLMLGLLLLAYLQGQGNAASRIDAPAASASPSVDAGAAPSAGAAAEPSAQTQHLPKLPGLIEANRLRLKTACIAGTVGHRRSNGWVQAVAGDAPRRCVATTQ